MLGSRTLVLTEIGIVNKLENIQPFTEERETGVKRVGLVFDGCNGASEAHDIIVI